MGVELVLVPGGERVLGGQPYDKDDYPRSPNRTSVQSFYIGKTEVTFQQWRDVMQEYPPSLMFGLASGIGGPYPEPHAPATGMTWAELQEFLRLTGFRLPTEDEWEFACRAGTNGPLYGPRDEISVLAWSHPVSTKAPNALGLYDMVGNADEVCACDWRGPDGAADSSRGVVRGRHTATSRTPFLRAGYVSQRRGFRVALDVRVE